MNIEELYQELIIDHGSSPRNCCALANATGSAEGFNPLCGDKVKVYLKIQNSTIEQASFTGNGCAISTASASLMTEALLGKTTTEALSLATHFKNNLTQPVQAGSEAPSLGKLEAFSGVREFPARVKCATLAWHTLQAAIKHETTVVCTENIRVELEPGNSENAEEIQQEEVI